MPVCKVCHYSYPAKRAGEARSTGYAWHARHDAGHAAKRLMKAAQRRVKVKRARRRRRMG